MGAPQIAPAEIAAAFCTPQTAALYHHRLGARIFTMLLEQYCPLALYLRDTALVTQDIE